MIRAHCAPSTVPPLLAGTLPVQATSWQHDLLSHTRTPSTLHTALDAVMKACSMIHSWLQLACDG